MRIPSYLARSLAIATLWLPVTAHAGKLTVQFDFGASSVAILGGFVNVPPDGAIQTASGEIDFAASGIATAQPGFANVRDLDLAGTLSKNDTNLNVNVTGAFGASQGSTGFGQIFAGLGSASFNPFLLNVTGFANCVGGAGCTILGLPATFTGPKNVSIPSLAIANLNSVGNALVSGSFTFTLGGFTAVLNLVGNEVGRTFVVPEPHTAGLLALGIAGLCIARRARRR